MHTPDDPMKLKLFTNPRKEKLFVFEFALKGFESLYALIIW